MNTISYYLENQTSAIFLMRHGHIDTGGEKRFIGHTDYTLSHQGRMQAEAWCHILSDIPFTRIYTSSLRRSQETAAIIAQGRSQEIEILPELDEINLGKWENLSFEEVMKNYPLEFNERGRNLTKFHPPAGESFSEVQKRVLKVFIPLMEQMQGHLLIIGHAGVNRVIICYLLGMPLKNLFRIEQDYGSLNIIAAGAIPRLLALNIKLMDPRFY